MQPQTEQLLKSINKYRNIINKKEREINKIKLAMNKMRIAHICVLTRLW